MDKSFKNNLASKLQSMQPNPDVKNPQDFAKTFKGSIDTIPEMVSQSAPLKSSVASGKAGLNLQQTKSALTEQQELQKEKEMKLEVHEELFFHYLSILAILPSRRSDLLRILDSFNENQNKSSSKVAGGSTLQKRLNQDTFVDIPDEAQLLRANTMLVELYVMINDLGLFIRGHGINQPNKVNQVDNVYEQANSVR